MQKYSVTGIDEIIALVGYGEISGAQLVNRMIEFYKKEHPETETQAAIKTRAVSSKKKDNGILIKGCSGMKTRFSHCCTPLPGDKIVGYVSRSRGVTIHRADCPNCKYFEPERIVEAEWPSTVEDSFVASIEVYAEDRIGLLIDVASTISEMKVAITNISGKKEKNGMGSVSVSVEVANIKFLESIINKLNGIKGVVDVVRV